MSEVAKAPRYARMGEAHPLAQRLRAVRLARGVTQREVARLAGVTQGSLCGYECGQREPSVGVLSRWAEALGLAVVLAGKDKEE